MEAPTWGGVGSDECRTKKRLERTTSCQPPQTPENWRQLGNVLRIVVADIGTMLASRDERERDDGRQENEEGG